MVAVKWLRAGLTWVLATAFAGLIPLWIRLVGVSLGVFPGVGWEQILKDGMLLYFSIAIVAAITIDYFLIGDVNYPKYTKIYMMGVFPVVLWFGSIVIYFLTFQANLDASSFRTALNVELVIAILSCIYALVHKATQITRAERT